MKKLFAILFATVAKRPLEKIVRATIPFYLCMLVALLLLSFVPMISLYFPISIGGYVPMFG